MMSTLAWVRLARTPARSFAVRASLRATAAARSTAAPAAPGTAGAATAGAVRTSCSRWAVASSVLVGEQP